MAPLDLNMKIAVAFTFHMPRLRLLCAVCVRRLSDPTAAVDTCIWGEFNKLGNASNNNNKKNTHTNHSCNKYTICGLNGNLHMTYIYLCVRLANSSLLFFFVFFHFLPLCCDCIRKSNCCIHFLFCFVFIASFGAGNKNNLHGPTLRTLLCASDWQINATI